MKMERMRRVTRKMDEYNRDEDEVDETSVMENNNDGDGVDEKSDKENDKDGDGEDEKRDKENYKDGDGEDEKSDKENDIISLDCLFNISASCDRKGNLIFNSIVEI